MKNTFSVCDQKIAYKLMKEGFECVKVKPSNKNPEESRMVFYFVGSDVFKERFNTILKEEIALNNEKTAEKCEKNDKNGEKSAENGAFCGNNADIAHINTMLDRIFDSVTAINFAVSRKSSKE
ncbi:MAG: hypothetical protein ACI4J7_08480 [Ruminiclostridium sp.]